MTLSQKAFKLFNHISITDYFSLIESYPGLGNAYLSNLKNTLMNMGYTAAGWTYLVDEHHIYGSSRVGVHNTHFILAKRFSTAEMEYTQKTANQVHFIRGKRNYELSNHLGNVQVVISDKRISVCDNELQTERFEADILMATDYYPFGMAIPERQWYTGSDSSNYRFGFNGQEKDNEVAGNGNSMTAEFWQYDSRLGRRWNTDPVVYPMESPYATFRNNPIYFNDPFGDCPDCQDGTYTVQKGDTYWDLENKWGLEHGTLESLNPGVDPKKLQVGQRIVASPDIPVNQPFTTTTTETRIETQYVTTSTKSWEASSGALLISGALVADDATVFGVVDDVLIPFILLGGVMYDIVSPSNTTTYPTSILTTTTTNAPSTFFYVTYTKTNPTTGQVYVGRASGYGTPQQVVDLRDANHHMTAQGYGAAALSTYAPATVAGGFVFRASDPSYWAIRGSEQLQIEHYRRMGISGNTYNGISPTNDYIGKYLNAARQLFGY